MTDFNIPMQQGPRIAPTNEQIPMGADTRLPMAVKPFTPVDPVANMGAAYKLADNVADFREKQSANLELQRVREEKQRDKTLLDAYIANGGDLNTHEGLQRAGQDLRGKISSTSYMNLGALADKRNDYEVTFKQKLANLNDSQLTMASKYQDLEMAAMSAPLQAYDAALNEGGEQAAVKAYEDTKAQVLKRLMTRKDSQGQPIISPEEAQQYQQMTRQQIKNTVETSTWGRKAMKEEAATRLANAKAESEETYGGIKGNSKVAEIRRLMADGTLTDEEGKKAISEAYNKGSEVKAPSGYRWSADKPGALEPVPGGPAEAKSKGQSGREAVFTSRVLTSANQAIKDLTNVAELPLTSSTGLLGGRQQGGSLLSATKEVLANQMTSEEVQLYNVMATGFQRSLAAIETSGLAPSGSLVHQMDTVLLKEGDTNLAKMSKMAQIRQIVEAGMETLLASPRVSDSEKEKAKAILTEAEKAVPFTQKDVIKLMANTDQNATLSKQMAKMTKKAKPTAEDFPSVSPAEQTARDKDRKNILQDERDVLAGKYFDAETADEKARIKVDIDAIDREIAGVGGKPAKKPAATKAMPLDAYLKSKGF